MVMDVAEYECMNSRYVIGLGISKGVGDEDKENGEEVKLRGRGRRREGELG